MAKPVDSPRRQIRTIPLRTNPGVLAPIVHQKLYQKLVFSFILRQRHTRDPVADGLIIANSVSLLDRELSSNFHVAFGPRIFQQEPVASLTQCFRP